MSERIGDMWIERELTHEQAADMVVAAIGGTRTRIVAAIKRALKTWEVERITFRRAPDGIQVRTWPTAREMRIGATIDA